jgi:hypothetical protein
VDAIWRAVLARDDAAMAAIDLDAGVVHLLIERRETTVEVTRLSESRWTLAGALFSGKPLAAALEATRDPDAPAWLAAHLAGGHFTAFQVETERFVLERQR